MISWLLIAWTVWIVGNILFAAYGGRGTRGQPAYVTGLFPPKIFLAVGVEKVLTVREQEALIAHELGHVVHGHIWINLLRVFIFWFPSQKVRIAQEIQADEFAQARGYALELAEALHKLSNSPLDDIRAEILIRAHVGVTPAAQASGIGAALQSRG
jgi:Zn-dependent protease with chaperone function